jgi:PGF-CTERM protein/uncharacterized repeat protein (TIGR01451 family)
MKRKVCVSVLVAVFVLMSFVGSAMAASGEVLVLHFDEGSGTVARDSSGYGNDGTIHGATWTTGISGKALRFDGNDDYVKIPNHPSLNPETAITISGWYKPVVSFKGAGVDPVVDKGYYSHTAPHYQYHLGVTGDRYETSRHSAFQFSVASDGAAKGVNTDYNFWIVGTWYYLVGTYDGEMTKLYVNGELISSTQAQGEMMDYGKDVYIAKYTNLNIYLPGTIDEVAIYSRALTADEIRAQYLAKRAGSTPMPEITLTKSASPSTIQEGETVTISVRVDNTGTGDAKTVEVTDTIPLGFKIISGSKSESFGEIKSGDYRTREYTLKATGSGKFTCDPATVTYTDADGNSYSCASNAMSLQVGSEVPVGADSDGDGWSDEKEREMGTNPYSVDSDSDGLNDPEDPNPTVPEKGEGIPGFEAVFAIAGLLAVAYLVRRRKAIK